MSSNAGRGAGGGAAATAPLAAAALDRATARFLVKLKGGTKRNEEAQRRAAHGLREFVDAQRREMPSRDFSAFFISLSHRIFDLVNSSDNYEKQGGILAMDDLIDIPVKENEYKIIRFANFLRGVFAQITVDNPTLRLAARALGHLARAGGPMTADFVEFEVKRALEWLQGGERYEARRHAAVLVLRQLADHAPTLFYQHVPAFFSSIWMALCDPKFEIRESAAKALCSCLALVRHRQSRYRAQWYNSIFKLAKTGVGKGSTAERIHGSLLTFGELLHDTGSFMEPRFSAVCDLVLKYRTSKDRLVRRSVIVLLPRLASFMPHAFASNYLRDALEHLLRALGNTNERAAAFVAVGRVALAVSKVEGGIDILRPHLPHITKQIHDGLQKKKSNPFCMEALVCVSMLSHAVQSAIKDAMHDLLSSMFNAGLNPTLTDALSSVVRYIPPLLPLVQERLLHELSLILAGAPFSFPGAEAPPTAPTAPVGKSRAASSAAGQLWNVLAARGAGRNSGMTEEEKSEVDHRRVQLALKTLSTFDFDGVQLLPFLRATVAGSYLDHEVPAIRREAAVTCAKLLLGPCAGGVPALLSHGPTVDMVAQVLERLLMVAIADPDADIRQRVLSSLEPRFDPLLAQADNLRSLCIALHDEVFATREAAITVIGRLAHRNPAYVMPALRKTLIQLLTELEFSGAERSKEEAARLLGHLIRTARALVTPYVGPILKALLPKLQSGGGTLASSVLATLGELSEVGAWHVTPHLHELLPLIIDTLQRQSGTERQAVAVRTLGKLVKNTGFVIDPYEQHPELLTTLLGILNAGVAVPWRLREEVLRTLGTLGALDPYRHKMNQLRLSKAKAKDVAHGIAGGDTGRDEPPLMLDGGGGGRRGGRAAVLLPSMVKNPDDYYPTVAISALMRILSDMSLTEHHSMVLQAIMWIFQYLNLQCVPFLRQIVPALLTVMRRPDGTFRQKMLRELGGLVRLVRHHIRPYLDDIFALISAFWPDCLEATLQLATTIAAALKDEFKLHLPKLIPLMLDVLTTTTAGRSGAGTSASGSSSGSRRLAHNANTEVLKAIVSLGPLLSDYLYLIIPALVRLVEQQTGSVSERATALATLGQLCKVLHISEYASRIVHPISRLLKDPSAPMQLKHTALNTLCYLVLQMQGDYLNFEPMVRKVLERHSIAHEQYERIVALVLTDQPLPADPVGIDHVAFGDFVGGAAGGGNGAAGMESKSGVEVGVDLQAEKLSVNQQHLKKAWEASQRSTKDDWREWMRRFSVELLRESPSPALRACSQLAQVYHPLARELFNPAFLCVWLELYDRYQDNLVTSLEAAFSSKTIPPEILQILLNLAEFMEHDEKALPIDIRVLGDLAEQCHAYAKALHYKELEFQTSPSTSIEPLISINNQLERPEAAVGILRYAQNPDNGIEDSLVDAQETTPRWYEKLGRWDDALEAYERKQLAAPHDMRYSFARLRCLKALGEWERLSNLSSDLWPRLSEAKQRRQVAPLAARASWAMGNWAAMERYVAETSDWDVQGAFFRAVLSIHKQRFSSALRHISKARRLLANDLTALVGESYNRAYRKVVTVQQLTEMEEIVHFLQLKASNQHDAATWFMGHLRVMWERRLAGCQRNVEVWQRVLGVRSLIVDASEDIGAWIQFASLCRKSNRLSLSLKTLMALGINGGGGMRHTLAAHNWSAASGFGFAAGAGASPGAGAGVVFGTLPPTLPRAPALSSSMGVPLGIAGDTAGAAGHTVHPRVVYAYLKHLWASRQRQLALRGLRRLTALLERVAAEGVAGVAAAPLAAPVAASAIHGEAVADGAGEGKGEEVQAGAAAGASTGMDADSKDQSGDIAAGSDSGDVAAERDSKDADGDGSEPLPPLVVLEGTPPVALEFCEDTLLRVKCHLKMGQWQLALHDGALTDGVIGPVIASFRSATRLSSTHYKAWHAWAVMNFQVVDHYITAGHRASALSKTLAAAVQAFFHSVSLGQGGHGEGQVLQDLLRLLTLWFTHGEVDAVHREVEAGLNTIAIGTWLRVMPQLIARIHVHTPRIRTLLHGLLAQVGRHHPQALVYPLTVASKSTFKPRQLAAKSLMDALRKHSAVLVDTAELVSHELIRVAILWNEEWYSALEECSRLYFDENNVPALLDILLPLHAKLEAGAETMREVAFQTAYGRELADAGDWLREYQRTGKPADISQAWDLYHRVFRYINKRLPKASTLELQQVSPRLLRARDLELAVPGTYAAGEEVVRIKSFRPKLKVISSKQRPRNITINGSDGGEYMFLLKGHEDLRQDERVMQLFGLVNALLNTDPETSRRDLSIQRYSVTPLSTNVGIVGWVPFCDTIHTLVKSFRKARKILLNIEHRLMCGMAPMYDHLTLIQTVEVFDYALENTTGQDLHKMLWLKSHSAEVWLERRTNYTQSLAVMSIVGYILGLGDRHTANLMLERHSGKIVHIDFGDCFEVAIHRKHHPETIPFRLTRMLVQAMEVSGIEGTFRFTCEAVMRVLRENRDSVMAMLEAFVHDPLINWRLLTPNQEADKGAKAPGMSGESKGQESDANNDRTGRPSGSGTGSGAGSSGAGSGSGTTASAARASAEAATGSGGAGGAGAGAGAGAPGGDLSTSVPTVKSTRPSDKLAGIGAPEEALNEKAVKVISRIKDKLTGRDFLPESTVLSVPDQVQRLIEQATSHENLCQCYIGWCPFW